MSTSWWQKAVFYQIYPRSFQDTTKSGIGDIAGIISRLDYIQDLGVTALWISPFFKSPMTDAGYDISDYCDIDPLFGTLDDVKQLIAEAHKRNIRLIFDLVINHTSIDHPWFIEARSSRTNAKHDWYLWHPRTDPATGKRRKKPNNWTCQFEFTSAWHDNDVTDEWYIGTFTKSQPEVNWRNPQLRNAMYDVIRFWLNMGIDGFRMDVVNWYLKDLLLRSNPLSLNITPDIFQKHLYDRNQDETHDICKEIRRLTDTYSNGDPSNEKILVGEIFVTDAKIAASYQGNGSDELHLAFNMQLLFQKWNAKALTRSLQRWYDALAKNAFPNITLSNHDQRRHAQRFYSPNNRIQAERCRIAAMLLLTARGTPFIYYGEELGMTGTHIPRKELQDPTGKTFYPLPYGRDPERTPMQWNASENAGFTSPQVRPWLRLQKNYKTVNVAVEMTQKDSILHWYKQLLKIRSENPVLQTGGFSFLGNGSNGVIQFARLADTAGYESTPPSYPLHVNDMIVLLNCTSFIKKITIPLADTAQNILVARIILGNIRKSEKTCMIPHITLAPYEALLLCL